MSIDDATPAEWDAFNRSRLGAKKMGENYAELINMASSDSKNYDPVTKPIHYNNGDIVL